MNYFVIGSGSIGTRHAQNLKTLGAKVSLHSWRGINLSKVLSEVRSCNGAAAVVIATGTNIRLPLILEFANEGAALYIEKPLAFKKKDLKEIYSLPEAFLSRSVVGFMMRYHPLLKKLLTYKFNDFYRARFEVGHNVTKWRKNWDFGTSYASLDEGGGVLLDLCHEIDIAQMLCGPSSIDEVLRKSDPRFPQVDLESRIRLINTEGRDFSVQMDYLAPQLTRRGSIISSNKQIDYDLTQDKIFITDETDNKMEQHILTEIKCF